MLGTATVIGWTPSEFWAATYTDLQDALRGWNAANGVKEPTREEVAHARDRMRAANERATKRAHTDRKASRNV